jgi:DNA-binding IclR family transcriptional regulator
MLDCAQVNLLIRGRASCIVSEQSFRYPEQLFWQGKECSVASESVQSVARAAEILKVLAGGGWGMGVSEIAQTAGLGKSTTHRLLSSLMQAEFVRMEPKSHRYTLGAGLLQLTATWFSEIKVRAVALPHLRALRGTTEETVSLSVRDGDSRIAIERLDTSHEVRFVVDLGRPLPLHIGAAGKAILAFLPALEIDEILQTAGLDPPAAKHVRKDLKDVRRVGTAYSRGERVAGSRSVSAPIFSPEGAAIASVSILSMDSRLDEINVAEFRSLAREAAINISTDFGWTG